MNGKKDIHISDILFCVALIIYLTSTILDCSVLVFSTNQISFLGIITKLIRYISYGIFVIKFFYDAFYYRRIILYLAFLAIIVGLSYVFCMNKTMIFYLIIFMGSINVPGERILKVSCFTQSILLFLLVVGSQLGIILDYVRADADRTRHFLGFSWTTTGAILFLFIILQYIYLRHGELSWIETLAIILISMFFYLMTDSRFAFAICVCSALFFAMFKNLINKGRITVLFKKILIIVPELVALFAIAIHYFYNDSNPVYKRINSLLSGRLLLGRNAIKQYGIPLFGQKIEWIGYSISEKLKGEYNYVDCSYIQILLEYGLLFLIIVLAFYSLMIKKSIDNKQYYFTWILLIILIFSVIEPRLLNLTFNPIPLLVVSGYNNLVEKHTRSYRFDVDIKKTFYYKEEKNETI